VGKSSRAGGASGFASPRMSIQALREPMGGHSQPIALRWDARQRAAAVFHWFSEEKMATRPVGNYEFAAKVFGGKSGQREVPTRASPAEGP
jgi:hypothetical protein